MLAASQLTDAIGNGAYITCSVLYFTRIVGLSPTQLGVGLTVSWGAGFLAGVPLGHLADRWGPRRTATALAIGTCLSVAAFLVVRSFPLFMLAACGYACCQSGLASARQALLAALVERTERTAVRAYLQAATNAGLALGAAVGGLALHFNTANGYLAILAMDAAGFAVSGCLLLRVPAVAAVPAATAGRMLAVLSDRPYALLTVLNTIMLLRMPIISLAIPLWIVERTHAASWLVSAVLVLNTVAVMLWQVRVSRRVRDLGSAATLVRQSGVLLLLSCAVFALSGANVPGWAAAVFLLLAAALQVLGEMMQSAGAWEISFELAPADRQGQYQGFFGTGTAVARMLGPVLLITLIVGWGASGWLLLGGMFLVAGLLNGPAVRWAVRTRVDGSVDMSTRAVR
ncbi:MAG TPA: MFS transporter [Pseudonocardiaceae bacterium]|nr:MFS transporter [Pseudonocardiaceae bacterium]